MMPFDTVDLLLAVATLGLPLAALSWFLFSLLFETGEIGRDANRKLISARVNELKKSAAKTPGVSNALYNKWMWMGSGFYGLAGLYTLVIIELRELFGFLANLSAVPGYFSDGIVSFLIGFLTNQIGNMVQAFVWWGYWPADSVVVWVLVAYLGYWVGVELARRHKLQSIQEFKQRLVAFFGRKQK